MRVAQQKMMEAVASAYTENTIALIEAGTGTGKSIAYLIPALIFAAKHNERTVISTHTISLQEQLIRKDIPALQKALGINLKVVLAKGMNNYICLRKLSDIEIELPFLTGDEYEEMSKIKGWCQSHKEGSRSDMPFKISAQTWDYVGAESTACNHRKCPHYQECYFFKARREAQEAQLLVVNHHLLFADLKRRAESDNYKEVAILPPYQRIILDEAHHIENVATEHFSQRINRLQLLHILSKLTSEKQLKTPGKLHILKENTHFFYRKNPHQAVKQILLTLTTTLPALKNELQQRIHSAFDALAQFVEATQKEMSSSKKLRLLKEHLSHPTWLEKISFEIKQLKDSLKDYQQSLYLLEASFKSIDNDKLNDQTKNVRLDIVSLASKLDEALQLLTSFCDKGDPPLNRVRWIENQLLKATLNVHLVDADLDISSKLAESLFDKLSTVILCSATMTANRQFDFMRKRIGLTQALIPHRKVAEHIYDSPFDYAKQALLAIPTDLPPPNHPQFNEMAFECIWKAIVASQGQAFVLFTSFAMMQECANALEEKLKAHLYPLFKQGDSPSQELLSKFKTTKRAVLFGTDSFWEGVDVAGDALRSVIIVKLPFKVPSEPLIQAKAEAIAATGGDPFFDLTVPDAIVKFKQGFGRLIRNRHDRGCIVCLDNRLITKGYGELFLKSLPPCKRAFNTGDLLWSEMTDFYRRTHYLTKKDKGT